jgi:hypothetical protein
LLKQPKEYQLQTASLRGLISKDILHRVAPAGIQGRACLASANKRVLPKISDLVASAKKRKKKKKKLKRKNGDDGT